jgi:hypothetical protein
LITKVVSRSNTFVFIGDQKESVRVLQYVRETHQFEIVGHDPSCRTVTALSPYKESVACGDIKGNVLVFGGWKRSLRAKRLSLEMSFHVGEVVSSVNVKESEAFQSLCYGTINGTIGCLIFSDNSVAGALEHEMNMRELKQVELAMSHEFELLTGADFLQFRNKMYPCSATLDLDLLLFYPRMSASIRDRIASRTSSKIPPQRIDQMIVAMEVFVSSIH